MDSLEDVEKLIRTAFANVRRGAITLHEADVLDAYGSQEEREAARLLDQDSKWEDIPEKSIEKFPYALCFLDYASWRYYIPAYMVWALKNYRTTQSCSADSIINTFDLTGQADWGLRPRTLERFRSLDETQSHAVYRFLRFMTLDDDPESGGSDQAAQCLACYWDDFSQAPVL